MRVIDAALPEPPPIAYVVRHMSAQPTPAVEALTREIVSELGARDR